MSTGTSVTSAPLGRVSDYLTACQQVSDGISDTVTGILTLAGRQIRPVCSTLDALRWRGVSTTLGRVWILRTRPSAATGLEPPLVELVPVAAFDPGPLGESVEVVRVDREQDERIGRKVPVSLDDGLNAHDVEPAVEVARNLGDGSQPLGVSDEDGIVADDAHAGLDQALGQPVAAEAGRIGPEAFQRGAHVFAAASRAAVPDDAVDGPGVDAETRAPVVMDGTAAVVLVPAGASFKQCGEAGFRAAERVALVDAKGLVWGHPAKSLLGRGVRAGRYDKLDTLLVNWGVRRGRPSSVREGPALPPFSAGDGQVLARVRGLPLADPRLDVCAPPHVAHTQHPERLREAPLPGELVGARAGNAQHLADLMSAHYVARVVFHVADCTTPLTSAASER